MKNNKHIQSFNEHQENLNISDVIDSKISKLIQRKLDGETLSAVLPLVNVSLCPNCGTDTLITLSDGIYCMNDCCDYYRANER